MLALAQRADDAGVRDHRDDAVAVAFDGDHAEPPGEQAAGADQPLRGGDPLGGPARGRAQPVAGAGDERRGALGAQFDDQDGLRRGQPGPGPGAEELGPRRGDDGGEPAVPGDLHVEAAGGLGLLKIVADDPHLGVRSRDGVEGHVDRAGLAGGDAADEPAVSRPAGDDRVGVGVAGQQHGLLPRRGQLRQEPGGGGAGGVGVDVVGEVGDAALEGHREAQFVAVAGGPPGRAEGHRGGVHRADDVAGEGLDDVVGGREGLVLEEHVVFGAPDGLIADDLGKAWPSRAG